MLLLPLSAEVIYRRNEDIIPRIREISKEINQWIIEAEERTGLPVLAVCVLRGSVCFYTDLLLNIPSSVEIAFCRAQSYSIANNSQEKGVKVNISDLQPAGRAVLLIDDICDSGSTLLTLNDMVSDLGAAEIKNVVIILRKMEQALFNPDWTCFHYSGDEWFIGYGMDYRNGYRNLPDIYKIPNEDR